jgi:hypothetical protein
VPVVRRKYADEMSVALPLGHIHGPFAAGILMCSPSTHFDQLSYDFDRGTAVSRLV